MSKAGATMLVSLSTASLGMFPLAAIYRLAREAGFDALELAMGPEVWVRGPSAVRALSRRHALPVLTVHQTLLPRGPHGGGECRMIDAAEVAREVGARHVVIHAPESHRWRQEQIDAYRRVVAGCQERLAGSITRLAIENHGYDPRDPRRPLLGPLDELLGFAREHDLDVTYDTCHAGMVGLDLISAFDQVGDRVRNVHLSNLGSFSSPLTRGLVRSLVVEHRMPDEGLLPLRGFVAALGARGYAHPITYELSPLSLRAWWPPAIRVRLAEAVAFVRKHAGRDAVPDREELAAG